MQFFLPSIIAFSLITTRALAQDTIFTGYATGSYKNDRFEYQTYGFKDKEQALKYDTLTRQPVGSVSKMVIGLALLKAQELGYLQLDNTIQHYIDFDLANPNLKVNSPITLRHLATHTSGIKDNEKLYLQSYHQTLHSPESLEEFVKSYLTKSGSRYAKNNFGKNKSGEEYNYSNIGAALAALVIERATKIPFDQFTAKYIFEPLKMNNTGWFYDDKNLINYALLYDEKDQPLPRYCLATYPDGGLKTTIIDLSKLLQTMIHGYQGKSDLLQKKSWEIFFAKNFADALSIKGINPREPDSGIFIIHTGKGEIGHTGSDPGVCAFVFFNPETKTGKLFMANEDLTAQNLNTFKEIWAKL